MENYMFLAFLFLFYILLLLLEKMFTLIWYDFTLESFLFLPDDENVIRELKIDERKKRLTNTVTLGCMYTMYTYMYTGAHKYKQTCMGCYRHQYMLCCERETSRRLHQHH